MQRQSVGAHSLSQAWAVLWRFLFWWRVAFLFRIFLSFRPLILLGEYTHTYFLCDIVLFEIGLWFDIRGTIFHCCFPNTCVVFLCCFGCAEMHSICVHEQIRGLLESILVNPKQQCCRRLFPPCHVHSYFQTGQHLPPQIHL